MQASKAIISEVESLDAALKKTKSPEECRQLVQQLRHDLTALIDPISRFGPGLE